MLQKSLLLGSAPYNPWGRCQRLSGLRVIDEPVRVLNLLFFAYFIWKWEKTFEKLHFFTFGSSQEYFEKLAFKKKQNKKCHFKRLISKARTNSESKVTFSESSFNFLQESVVFSTLYPRGYRARGFAPYHPWCRCERLTGLKELKNLMLVLIMLKFNFRVRIIILKLAEDCSQKVCGSYPGAYSESCQLSKIELYLRKAPF